MGQTEPTRQADEILPPIAGSIVVVAVPASPSSPLVIDLTTWSNTAALPSTTTVGMQRTNPFAQYISMVADLGQFYYAFGPTAASVASISPTATSTITGANAIPSGSTTNGAVPLPQGTLANFRLPPGPSNASASGNIVQNGNASPARFLALIAATGVTANCVLFVSSR